MAVLDYDRLNTRSNNIARSELVNYLTKIGCRETRHTGSHKIFQNAAGSIMTVAIGGHKPDVSDNLRKHALEFVDEHLAELSKQQEKAYVAPPTIHFENEAQLEKYEFDIHALSQEDRTVTLTDISYSEIGVEINLHDDLAVTESHIKAAAAERDALKADYIERLTSLKQRYNIKRIVAEDGSASLQMLSRSSGRLKKETTLVMLPVPDDYESIEELSAARNAALDAIEQQAIDLQEKEAPGISSIPQRSAAERQAEFDAMCKELQSVGLHLSVKRVGSNMESYCIGEAPGSLHAAVQRMMAHNIAKSQKIKKHLLKRFETAEVEATNEDILTMQEFSHGDAVYCWTPNFLIPEDGAPTEEALKAIHASTKEVGDSFGDLESTLRKLANVDTHRFNGRLQYSLRGAQLKPNEKSQSILAYIDLSFWKDDIDAQFKNTTLDKAILGDLAAFNNLRVIIAGRAYEAAMIQSIQAMGATTELVRHEDQASLILRGRDKQELTRVPCDTRNLDGIIKYVSSLAEVTKSLYDHSIPPIMAGHGWDMTEQTDATMVFTHREYPDLQAELPRFDIRRPNVGDIIDGFSAALNAVKSRKEGMAEDAMQQEYTRCIDSLKCFGYTAHANGKLKLLPPQNVPGLSAIIVRDVDTTIITPAMLKQAHSELAKAQGLIESQARLVHQLQTSFGDRLIVGEKGIAIKLMHATGCEAECLFHYAKMRDGKPSQFFDVATYRRLSELNGIEGSIVSRFADHTSEFLRK